MESDSGNKSERKFQEEKNVFCVFVKGVTRVLRIFAKCHKRYAVNARISVFRVLTMANCFCAQIQEGFTERGC